MTAPNSKLIVDIVDLEKCQGNNETGLSLYVQAVNDMFKSLAKTNPEWHFSLYVIQNRDPIRYFMEIGHATDLYNFEFANETAYGLIGKMNSIAHIIDKIGIDLSAMEEEHRPSSVVINFRFDFVGSFGFDKIYANNNHDESIKALSNVMGKIKHQREIYSWEFNF